MNAIVIEAATATVVFVAVLAAFQLTVPGRRGEERAHSRNPHPGFEVIQPYNPPVDIRIEYCRPGGFSMLRNVKILRALSRRGRLYLFGLCDRDAKPRIFRADRISCFATLDGEVIDTQTFLTGVLAIPPESCPTSASRRASL